MALFDGSRIWDVAGGVALCIAAGRAVYTKPRRADAGWRPFTHFCDRVEGPVTMSKLRAWSDPLVAGDASVLPSSASALKREQSVAATAKRAAVKSVKRAFPNLPLAFVSLDSRLDQAWTTGSTSSKRRCDWYMIASSPRAIGRMMNLLTPAAR